ncbi:MAG: hypothetical protein IJF64_00790 [Clostridia bacterium]|nr:hypothetical protein [Clostridia bacterium]
MQEKETKKTGKMSDFFHKVSDVSKKAVKGVSEGTKTVVQRMKENSEAKKLEKLAPLFMEEYESAEFHIPNVIKLVDDAERRGNELCEGAIGWREKEQNTEVLFLYDEMREKCGLEFVPSFEVNSVYCVDPFDATRKSFIKADVIFNRAEKERLAELEKIAYCLGAKRCSVQILTAEKEKTVKEFNAKTSGTVKVTSDINVKQVSEQKTSGKTVVEFGGHNKPTRPDLKWFAYDSTIKNLIEMRCKNPKSVKSRVLEISVSSMATMSRETAMAIDGLQMKAIKSKSSTHVKMEDQANKEWNSKLVYIVEF